MDLVRGWLLAGRERLSARRTAMRSGRPGNSAWSFLPTARRGALACRLRPAAGAWIAVLIATLPLGGQEPRVLTLEEALELARLNSPVLRQAMNELELTPSGMRAAWGAFLPSLSLNLGTGITLNRRLQAEDFFGNPIANPNVAWVTNSSSNQSISASLNLFEGGGRFHQRGFERAQGIVRERSFQLELAIGTQVDLLAAELDVQQQERQTREAESEHAKALLGLRAETGAQLGPFTTRGTLPEPFDPSVLDEDRLIARALEQSPRIQRDQADVDAGRASLRAVQSTRWPTLSLSGSYFQSAYGQEYGAFFEPFSNDSRYASAAVRLSLPLFTGFSTENRIAEARIRLVNAEEGIRQSEMELERDVRSRLIDLRGAYDGYRLAERASEIAEERLRLAREEYRLASRSFSDLQGAIEEAASEQRAAINARHEFMSARIALEQAVGGPLNDDP